jgi:hypothetical protein
MDSNQLIRDFRKTNNGKDLIRRIQGREVPVDPFLCDFIVDIAAEEQASETLYGIVEGCRNPYFLRLIYAMGVAYPQYRKTRFLYHEDSDHQESSVLAQWDFSTKQRLSVLLYSEKDGENKLEIVTYESFMVPGHYHRGRSSFSIDAKNPLCDWKHWYWQDHMEDMRNPLLSGLRQMGRDAYHLRDLRKHARHILGIELGEKGEPSRIPIDRDVFLTQPEEQPDDLDQILELAKLG